MSKENKVFFRCRNCGDTYFLKATTEKRLNTLLTYHGNGSVHYHSCKDGTSGASDILGYQLAKQEEGA